MGTPRPPCSAEVHHSTPCSATATCDVKCVDILLVYAVRDTLLLRKGMYYINDSSALQISLMLLTGWPLALASAKVLDSTSFVLMQATQVRYIDEWSCLVFTFFTSFPLLPYHIISLFILFYFILFYPTHRFSLLHEKRNVTLQQHLQLPLPILFSQMSNTSA